MRTGDLAVLLKQEQYEVGDVVAFTVKGGNVIHRIVGGSAAEGFILRGDNKNDDDPWKPTPDQILGKMWFFVPGGGRVFANLRQPANFAVLVGGLAAVVLLGGSRVQKRRRRGGHMTTVADSRSTMQLPGPAWALALMGLLVVFGLALAAAAGYAFRLPTEKQEFAERARYEHAAAFDYTVKGQPSTLYPTGEVGPVLPPADPAAKVAPPGIYTKLAQTIDVGFNYNLQSALPPIVSGDLGARLEIKAGDSWSKSEELLPPTPFQGPVASARVAVDLASVWSLIDTIEKETGVGGGTYTLSVAPTVRVKGSMGAEPIEESYAPAFAFKLTKQMITPDQELTKSEVKRIGDNVTRQQEVSLGGLALPVATVRWAGLTGAIPCLALAGLLAAYVFLGIGRGESARIRARYGSLLISVAEAELKPETERVRLASLDDLAKLAQRDGQTIFYRAGGSGSDLYFIHHGEVIYTFTLEKVAGKD